MWVKAELIIEGYGRVSKNGGLRAHGFKAPYYAYGQYRLFGRVQQGAHLPCWSKKKAEKMVGKTLEGIIHVIVSRSNFSVEEINKLVTSAEEQYIPCVFHTKNAKATIRGHAPRKYCDGKERLHYEGVGQYCEYDFGRRTILCGFEAGARPIIQIA